MTISNNQSEHEKLLFEIGKFINDLRVKKKLSLVQLSARVGVNPSYLREVECGKKVPDDQLIRNLAEYFGFDENYIYSCIGKVPLKAREELQRFAILQETLKEIGMSSLTEQEKEEIYNKFYSMAKTALINGK